MPKTPAKTTRALTRKPPAGIKPSNGEYKITMQMGGETFVAFGVDPVEVIGTLKPDKITAKAIFTLEHGGKRASLSRRAQWARYTLNNRSVAFHLAKNLVALLK